MAQEIPPLLQPGDKEDAIGRILDARTPEGALLGPEGKRPTPTEGLERYRTVINQVHPDRCADRRASAAFERASRAFDALVAADSRGSPEVGEWDAPRPCRGVTWWEFGGIRDLDRVLEFRIAVTNLLWSELAPSLDARGLERLQRRVADAERMCEHLDRGKGQPRSRLWPSSPSIAGSLEAQARCLAVRLVDVLCYLRVVHRYCQLTGRSFAHLAELEAFAAWNQVTAQLRVMLTADANLQYDGASYPAMEMDLTAPEGDDPDGVDPLDAFMTGIEAELETLHSVGATSAPTLGGRAVQAANPTGAMECSLPTVGSKKRQASEAHPGFRLATGGVVQLAPEKAPNNGLSKGLQDKLLGDLDSDESEIEDK